MYVVVRQPKSVGIALLLTILFGPIGLFYATVTGGLVMTFGLIILTIGCLFFLGINPAAALLLFGSTLLIWALFGWLICIIWAIVGVTSYNRKLIINATNPNDIPLLDQTKSTATNQQEYESISEQKKVSPAISLLVISLVLIIGYLVFDKYQLKHRTESEQVVYHDGSVYSAPNVKSDVIAEVNENEAVGVISETVYFTKIKLIQKDGNVVYGFVKKPFISQRQTANASSHAAQETPNEAQSAFSVGDILSQLKDSPSPYNIKFQSNDEANDEPLTEGEEGVWRVISAKAYFHQRATETSKKRGYLVKGDVVHSNAGSDHFIYATFENAKGQLTTGFLLRENLVAELDNVAMVDSLSK